MQGRAPEHDLLLLDEPISGLDPLGIKQVRDLILEENREGRTVFISSHQLSEMERLCHRVAIISRYDAEFAARLGKFRLPRISSAVGRFLECGDYDQRHREDSVHES